MQVTVNGTTVEVPDGASVSVVNNEIIINGNKMNVAFFNDLKIEVIGGAINLKTDRGSVTVHGEVKGNIDAGGSVKVEGNVGGKVDANGSVTCGDVNGDIDASGSVKCGKVSGNVKASGSIISR